MPHRERQRPPVPKPRRCAAAPPPRWGPLGSARRPAARRHLSAPLLQIARHAFASFLRGLLDHPSRQPPHPFRIPSPHPSPHTSPHTSPHPTTAGLRVFSALSVAAPCLATAGACLLLRHNAHRDADVGKAAPTLLLLSTFLFGSVVIGLPASVAEAYGDLVPLFVASALLSSGSAAAGLALCVALFQRAGARLQEETARLTSATSEALAASERRVEQMDLKMQQMLEQQARLLELLAGSQLTQQQRPAGGGAAAASTTAGDVEQPPCEEGPTPALPDHVPD